MNERIRELIKQATHVEEPDGLFLREVFDQAKFAELIVRECVEICRSEDWEDQQGWGKLYAHNIKKHFGIQQ